jgi:hypothetical protein
MTVITKLLIATTGVGFFTLGASLVPAQAFTINPSQGEFKANNDILQVISPWSYQGTLQTLNLSSTDEQCFISGIFKCLQSRTVTASILTTTAPTAYSIQLKGDYPSAPSLRSWGGNNLANRLNKKIPSEFRDSFGLTTPVIPLFAAFTQSYKLNTDREFRFSVNQFGCPSTVQGGRKTAFCKVDDVSFGGQLTAFANLQAIADTTNNIIGNERVTIRAQSDRISQFLINEQLLASGDISGSTKDGKITPLVLDFTQKNARTVDFTFKAGLKGTDGKIVPEVGFEAVVKNLFPPSDELDSASISLLIPAFKTSQMFDVGLNKTYKIEFRDTPSLSAGIFGDSFTAASVLAQMSASQPIVNYQIKATAVPEPIPEAGTTMGLFFGSTSILLLRKKRRRTTKS